METLPPTTPAEPAAVPVDTPTPKPLPLRKPEPPADVEVQGIPAVLVWSLGGMAVLMCLVAVGMGLYSYWDSLDVWVKALSLLLVPVLLWCGYFVAAKYGLRSAEVAAVFAGLSWLVLLVLIQSCIYALPLWQMGIIFVGGLLILPLLHPWRSAVVALGAGWLGAVVLLWWAVSREHAGMGHAWLWVCLLASLMLWAVGGAWCMLTRRRGYAPFGKLAPVAFALFLCAFYALVVFPQYLLGEVELSGSEWGLLSAVWLVPVVVALPLHARFSRRQKRSVFTYSLLAFGGLSLVSVPLLMLVNMPFLTAPLAFLYALGIIYYGADYKSPWLVLAGCVAFFLSSLSIPLRLGVNPLGSACILLLLGGLFLFAAFRLNARRRRVLVRTQLARRKQEKSAPPAH